MMLLLRLAIVLHEVYGPIRRQRARPSASLACGLSIWTFVHCVG